MSKFPWGESRLCDGVYLAAGVLCAALALYTHDLCMVFATLFFGGGGIAAPYARKMANERLRRRMRQLTEGECRLFDTQAAELHERLLAGKMRYLVEWWEADAPFIDENAHLLFVFCDGAEMDFVLHAPTREKLAPLLAKHGIALEWSYRPGFDSRILYPPALVGQPYYTPDGKPRPKLPTSR